MPDHEGPQPEALAPRRATVADLSEQVAGLTRRVRMLEGHAAGTAGLRPQPRFTDDLLGWVKAHGWTIVYVLLGAANLVGFVVLHDWLLLVGAATSGLMAWLTVE